LKVPVAGGLALTVKYFTELALPVGPANAPVLMVQKARALYEKACSMGRERSCQILKTFK
jgi:TPR repeat protein